MSLDTRTYQNVDSKLHIYCVRWGFVRWIRPEISHVKQLFHTYSIIQAKFARVIIYTIVPYSLRDLKVAQCAGKSQIYDPFVRYICS